MFEPIRTWHHSRKGRITGRIVRQAGEWLHIELAADHVLRVGSRFDDGHRDKGEVIVVRESFLTEITEN